MRIQPSSRIVGYQNIDLPKGYSLYTVTFKKIGGGNYNFDDVIPMQNGAQLGGMGQLSFQKCDTTGTYLKGYIWYPAKGGWCQGVTKVDNITLEDGQAVCFNAKQEGICIQVSGEVELKPVSMVLGKGYNLIGNMTPNEINLQDIIPMQTDMQLGGMGQVSLQKCDATGTYLKGYIWYPAKGGWCQGVTYAEGVTFKPGEAFCANAKQEGITLKFKSPLE